MLKLAALLIVLLFVSESKQEGIFEPYLQWFGLKGTYIPYVNDNKDEIEHYKAQRKRAMEGLKEHFQRQREKMRKKFEL